MKDGTMKVVRNAEKVFVGKDIIHTAVWKKMTNELLTIVFI